MSVKQQTTTSPKDADRAADPAVIAEDRPLSEEELGRAAGGVSRNSGEEIPQ